MAVTNPWAVESYDDFRYYCCPECDFKKEGKKEFIDHVSEHHPDAQDHIGNKIGSETVLPVNTNNGIEQSNSEGHITNKNVSENIALDNPNNDIEQPEEEGLDKEKNVNETLPPTNIKQEPLDHDEEGDQILAINKIVSKTLLDKDSQKFDYKHYLNFVVTRYGKWQCKICSKEYKGVSMKNHMDNMHHEIVRNYFLLNVQYNNNVEVVEYMDENLMSAERLIKKADSKHKCHDCPRVFLSSKVLSNHRKKNHPQVKKSTRSAKYTDHEDFIPEEIQYKSEPKLEFDIDEEADDYNYNEPFDYSTFYSSTMEVGEPSETNDEIDIKDIKESIEKPEKKVRLSETSKHKIVDGKPFCDKHKIFFPSLDMLRKHNLEYHKHKQGENQDNAKLEITEKCHLCEIDFENYNLFRVHLKQFHRKDGKYSCPQCGIDMPIAKCFPLEANFIDHLALEHGIGPIPFRVCDVCGETFHSNIKYLKHTKTSHREKKPSVEVFCDQCGKNFQTRSGLTNHLKNVHTNKTITPEDRVKKCEHCEAEFDHPDVMETHLKVCLRDHKDFKCKFCESYWVSHLSLELHALVNHGKLKYACDDCGKLYDTTSHLKHHKKVDHEKAHECVCHICAKTFATKPRLRRHLQWAHDIGEKKFKCEQCDIKFVDKHHLKEHYDKVHDTENVYPCDQCPKTFQVRSYLNTHIRIVHKKHRPHQCDICLERFLYGRDVIRHKKFHHKID